MRTGDIYDAVDWANLVPLSGPVLAWMDGKVSAWPPEAFRALEERIAGRMTTQANEAWEIFDAEAGDAGNGAVATAIANRLQARQASTAYTNQANLPDLTAALQGKGLHWTDAQFWGEPGCFLWAAAPGTTPGEVPAWCPVAPVAVQDRWLPGYDISTTFYHWPTVPALVPVPDPAQEDADMVMIRDPQGHVCTFNGAHKAVVYEPASMAALEAAGIKVVNVTQAQFNVIPYAK